MRELHLLVVASLHLRVVFPLVVGTRLSKGLVVALDPENLVLVVVRAVAAFSAICKFDRLLLRWRKRDVYAPTLLLLLDQGLSRKWLEVEFVIVLVPVV